MITSPTADEHGQHDEHDERGALARTYDRFARTQAHGSSPCFEEWCLAIARDPGVLDLVAALPPPKRQPNLVLAAARWHGAPPGPYGRLREVLLDRWPDVRATVLARSTQTNEAARCATLLPVLAEVAGPVALLEVGASAGLCMLPDRYGYAYRRPGGAVVTIQPTGGPSAVTLRCDVDDAVPLPARAPEVVWRRGIDRNPLDVADEDAVAWLETLVWPEHDERRRRLRAAVALARADPPRIERGDLLETLPSLAAEAPSGTTLVVQDSAVLAYLTPVEREAFVLAVGRLGARWVSAESNGVLVQVDASPPARPDDVVVCLDGVPRALAGPHGQRLRWLGA